MASIQDLCRAFDVHRWARGEYTTTKILSRFGGLDANGMIDLDSIAKSDRATAIAALDIDLRREGT